MVYYTGLAQVARRTGYPVVEVAGWRKRGHGHMKGCRSIMVHHTVGRTGANAPTLNYIRDNILSQYVLGRDGTIYVVAAGLCYHAGKVSKTAYQNSYSIGIEAENNGTGEAWPTAQLDSYVKLCAELTKEFKLPVSAVVGHKEAAVPKGRKSDPYFKTPSMTMAQFRGHVKKGYYTTIKPAVTKPTPKPPAPKPSAKAWPQVALPSTNAHTNASHAAWMKLMADIGYKDAKLGVALQKWLRNTKDSKGRSFYPAPYLFDGVMGPVSIRGLQWFLRTRGHYSTAYVVDGVRGPATVRAEIAYLNSQRRFY